MAPFSSKKNRFDTPGPTEKLFTRDIHNFRFHRLPTIDVSSSDCGPSGQIGNLNAIAAAGTSAELFPTLTWHFESKDGLEDDLVMERLKETTEYFVIVEDLDGGTLLGPTTPMLGVYFSIRPGKTTINANDLVKAKEGKFERIRIAQRGLVGGFKYGDLDGKLWRVPKSMHRIHFQVLALSKPVDSGSLSEYPTKASFRGATEGSVVGWGEWVGIYQKE